jgi:hypothetical protein
MRKLFEAGGLIAGIVLVVFGAIAIYMGVAGRQTVQDNIKREAIVGSPDMTPALIQKELDAAKLTVAAPTCTIAGKDVTDGTTAKCFADYMRMHTLLATGGQTYSQMGRFLDANGKATNDETLAAKGANGKPVENGLRNMWVNETALTTALNVSYMAEQLALFGLVVGIALLLSGIGFVVLALTVLKPLVAAKDLKVDVGKTATA